MHEEQQPQHVEHVEVGEHHQHEEIGPRAHGPRAAPGRAGQRGPLRPCRRRRHQRVPAPPGPARRRGNRAAAASAGGDTATVLLLLPLLPPPAGTGAAGSSPRPCGPARCRTASPCRSPWLREAPVLLSSTWEGREQPSPRWESPLGTSSGHGVSSQSGYFSQHPSFPSTHPVVPAAKACLVAQVDENGPSC